MCFLLGGRAYLATFLHPWLYWDTDKTLLRQDLYPHRRLALHCTYWCHTKRISTEKNIVPGTWILWLINKKLVDLLPASQKTTCPLYHSVAKSQCWHDPKLTGGSLPHSPSCPWNHFTTEENLSRGGWGWFVAQHRVSNQLTYRLVDFANLQNCNG